MGIPRTGSDSSLNLFVEHIVVVAYVGQVSEHNAFFIAPGFGLFGLLTMLEVCSSNVVFAYLCFWTST